MVATILGVMGLPTSANTAEGDFTVSAPTKTINLTAYAPIVANDHIFSIPTKNISLTAYAPIVVFDNIISVPTKNINFTAYAPDVFTFETNITIPIPTKTIRLSTEDTSLVDGFENWSGGLPVGWNNPAGTVSQNSDLNFVSQGNFSARLIATGGNTSILNQLDVISSPKTYAIDVFVVSGTARFLQGNSGFSSTSTPGWSTLYATNTNTSGNILIGSPGAAEFYVDNLRIVNSETTAFTDSVVAVPTKTVNITAYAPEVFIAEYTIKAPTKEVELTGYTPIVYADTYIQVPTKEINLTAYAPVVFISEYVFNVPTKEITLTTYAPTIGITIKIQIPTKEINLTAHAPNVLTDSVVSVPTKDVELTAYPPQVDAGFIFNAPTQDINLVMYAPEVGVPFSKEYFVMVESPFNYELIGVDVNSVSGEGRFDILVGQFEMASDLPFTSTSQNIPLSVIIGRGQMVRIRVQTLNQLFQSFNARLALKRI